MEDDYNKNLHLWARGKLYMYSRRLRKESTNAEKILWEKLKNRNLNGFKFRRQHPLGGYIADFYCHEKKLVIELDGGVHDEEMNAIYDVARTLDLKDSAIKVIRFKNEEVETNLRYVLNEIRKALINIEL